MNVYRENSSRSEPHPQIKFQKGDPKELFKVWLLNSCDYSECINFIHTRFYFTYRLWGAIRLGYYLDFNEAKEIGKFYSDLKYFCFEITKEKSFWEERVIYRNCERHFIQQYQNVL